MAAAKLQHVLCSISMIELCKAFVSPGVSGDPDTHGAIPACCIGYNTYTPNYPAILGVANSFAPNVAGGSAYPAYGNNNSTPSLPPEVIPTDTAADYNYYYERKVIDESNVGKAYAAPNIFASSFVPQQPPVYNYRAIPSFPSDRDARPTGERMMRMLADVRLCRTFGELSRRTPAPTTHRSALFTWETSAWCWFPR